MKPIQFTITIIPPATSEHSALFDVELERELHAFACKLVRFYSRGVVPKVTLEKHEVILPIDALRFIYDQSLECRNRDTHEALTLLLPSLMQLLRFRPMTGYESEQFRRLLREALKSQTETQTANR